MPLYDFLCAEGHRFDRLVKLANFDDPQHCACGAGAMRQLSAPRVISDHIEPCLGMDGKMHDSLASYRATLRADGNPQGENYIELGNERVKPVERKFDRKQRVDDIKAAIADVREGRVPPVTVSPVAD